MALFLVDVFGVGSTENSLISVLQPLQVSAALHHLIMNSRSLWLVILRRVAMEEAVAPFSIPLQSMPTQDIIRCATRPFRLLSALRSEVERKIPSSGFVLRPAPLPAQDKSDEQLRVVPSSVTILPGGRWLVGGILGKGHVVCQIACWDLQQVAECWDTDVYKTSPPQLLPVAQIAWDGGHMVEIEVRPIYSPDSVHLLAQVPRTSRA